MAITWYAEWSRGGLGKTAEIAKGTTSFTWRPGTPKIECESFDYPVTIRLEARDPQGNVIRERVQVKLSCRPR